jgi:hypothetical protein
VITVSQERISGSMIQYPWYIKHLQIIYPGIPDGCRKNQKIMYRKHILDDTIIGLVKHGPNQCLQVLVLQFATTLNIQQLKRVFRCLTNLWLHGSTGIVYKIKLLSGPLRGEDILYPLMLDMICKCNRVQLTVEIKGEVIDRDSIWDWFETLDSDSLRELMHRLRKTFFQITHSFF